MCAILVSFGVGIKTLDLFANMDAVSQLPLELPKIDLFIFVKLQAKSLDCRS